VRRDYGSLNPRETLEAKLQTKDGCVNHLKGVVEAIGKKPKGIMVEKPKTQETFVTQRELVSRCTISYLV